MTRPYLASEDSELLRRALASYSGGACLEIGAGNAGTLVDLSVRFGTVVGTDLAMPGMVDWRARGADFVLADRARCFRSESFELVVFNPPYLPSEEVSDPAVDGLKDGAEVPLSFLREALRVVTRQGRVVFLLSDTSPRGEFEEICGKAGFQMRQVAEMRLFYERLCVFEAAR